MGSSGTLLVLLRTLLVYSLAGLMGTPAFFLKLWAPTFASMGHGHPLLAAFLILYVVEHILYVRLMLMVIDSHEFKVLNSKTPLKLLDVLLLLSIPFILYNQDIVNILLTI